MPLNIFIINFHVNSALPQVLEEEEYKFVAVWSRALKSGLPHRFPFPFDQTRKSRGAEFDNFLIRTAPDSWIHCSQWHLKNQILENSNYFLFCISLTDWAALHDVSADFPNCEVTLPLHRLQPELLYSKLQSEKQEVSEWCESHKFSSKDFYVESLGKCSKGSIGCAQWAWDCGLWTIKLHFIKEQTPIFTFSELLGWCLISLTFMSRRWKVLSQHIFLRVCNLTIFPHSKAFPVPDFRLNKLEPGMHYVVGEFWTAQIR